MSQVEEEGNSGVLKGGRSLKRELIDHDYEGYKKIFVETDAEFEDKTDVEEEDNSDRIMKAAFDEDCNDL